jgi:hypothetical protein
MGDFRLLRFEEENKLQPYLLKRSGSERQIPGSEPQR